jgi:glutamyl-tRNA synthetase
MINFLSFIGFNPGGEKEIFTPAELVEIFDLHKIQKSGAQWSDDKLDWMNKEHMKILPETERNEKVLEWLSKNENLKTGEKLKDEKFMQKLFPIIFDRISKWGDIDTLISEGELTYFFTEPEYKKEMLCWKENSLEDAKKHLQYVVEVFEKSSSDYFDDIEKIKSLIFDYATQVGRGNVLWPLRVSLSGKEKSPDPFTLVYILGKDESIARIKKVLN